MSKDPPEVLKRVQDGLALVETIASQLKRTLDPSAEYDELVAYGREALLDLARRYDPTLGVPFRLFATPRLQGAMKDGIRRMVPLSRRVHENLTAPREAGDERNHRADKHVARVATAQADRVLPKPGVDTAGEFLAVSPKTLADEVLQRNDGQALLERCIGMMPASEGAVIRGFYLDDIPIDRLARELGLSRRKARILHERGLERLKKLMAHATGE